MSNLVKIDQVSWCFIWLCPKVHLFVTMCAQWRILLFIKLAYLGLRPSGMGKIKNS